MWVLKYEYATVHWILIQLKYQLYISSIQPQNDADTGLILAALNGNSEVVHFLLVSGADPNTQNMVSGIRVHIGTVMCERQAC